MVAFGARKPKAAIKSSVKTVAIQQPTFTEWHDLQVNEINRLPLHTMHFAYDPNDFPGTGAEYQLHVARRHMEVQLGSQCR